MIVHDCGCGMQARAIVALGDAVTSETRALEALVTEATLALQSAVAAMVSATYESTLSRRNSRNSMASVDGGHGSGRSTPAESNILQFSLQHGVVDAISRKLVSSGLTPDQVTGLYTFSCDNKVAIGEIPLPRLSSGVSSAPVVTVARVRSRGDIQAMAPPPIFPRSGSTASLPPLSEGVPFTVSRKPVVATRSPSSPYYVPHPSGVPPTVPILPISPSWTPQGIVAISAVVPPPLSLSADGLPHPLGPGMRTSLSADLSKLALKHATSQ